MVLKMQELLLSRGLKPGDVMLIFLEFDTSGDGAPHRAAHTAPRAPPHTPTLMPPLLTPPSHAALTPLSHPFHTFHAPTPLSPPSPTRTPPCTPHAPAP